MLCRAQPITHHVNYFTYIYYKKLYLSRKCFEINLMVE